MKEPIAYAAVAMDASESICVTTDKEKAEALCRDEGWMLLPLHHLPVKWEEEAAAVDAAFQRSGVKRTWPDDEPDMIIPMVNAMADEIELLRGYRDEAESDAAIAHLLVDKLRLTDAERSLLTMLVDHPRTHELMYDEEATLRGLLERTKRGEQ